MKSNTAPRSGALSGLTVIECGTGVSAPFCARLLADLGARVIKLEPPGGDPARTWGPFPGGVPHPERSAAFGFLNGGKESLELAGTAADGEAVAELSARADLLVTNLPPAQRRGLGVDLDRLREISPRLVTVAIPPVGETGPLAGHRAEEITVCALGAASVILGEPGRPPLHFPFNLPALQAGLHGAAAALAAVLARRRVGRGQHVEVSEADVLAFYCGGMSLFILGSGGKWRRRGYERHGAMYPSGFYPCKDGFIFIATQTRAQWTGFLRLMGDPEWASEDPALRDGVAIGWKRADEVDLHFIPWLTQYTRRELTEMAREQNLVLGAINNIEDLLDEPHLEAREFWAATRLGDVAVRMPGPGYRLSATPWKIGEAPRLNSYRRAAARSAVLGAPEPSSPARAGAGRPLSEYRAVEFGFNWAGPLVGQILADMGMEVIKVETQDRLDFMRHWAHARKFFHNANRGKLSVSANVKHPEGIELVRRLTARADIVFDNFAAGVMARNGLGYDDLRRVKSDIIVMSMAMAGQDGPLRHLRGFATIATGFAGLESAIGYADTGATGLPSLGLGDTNAAIQGVLAVLAALEHRERTGAGQFIDLSQIEAAATLVGEPLAAIQLGMEPHRPCGNDHPRMAPHGIYPTAGKDRWVAIAVAADEEWNALVHLMGLPAWAIDPGLEAAAGRLARREEIDARLSEWTAPQDRDEIVERLQGAGIAAEPVVGIEDLRTHPHFRHRGLCREIASFEGEAEVVYDTPWYFSLTEGAADRPSPKVGEHNEYVFGEVCGLSRDEIRALIERRAMW